MKLELHPFCTLTTSAPPDYKIIDRFCSSRCLNEYIYMPNMTGLF